MNIEKKQRFNYLLKSTMYPTLISNNYIDIQMELHLFIFAKKT